MSSSTTQFPTTASRRRFAKPRRGGLRARISVLAHRGRLDRLLAAGLDPVTSDELCLRAAQITRPSHREALASGLERALDAAERTGPRMSSAVPPAKREVRAARGALLDLCGALRVYPQVDPAGVALAQELLTDGRGPLYVKSRGDALERALRRAALALEVHA